MAAGHRSCGFAVAAIAAPAQVSLTTVVELAQKNSASVRLAEADVNKAMAQLAQNRDVFIPSLSFGSGLPAFREVGFTGALPTIWDSTIQSLVFSMPQIQYIRAARAGLKASQLSLKDAREQAALDASTAYIELDTVNREIQTQHQQERDAARLVEIEQQRTEGGVDPLGGIPAGEVDGRAIETETAAPRNARRDAHKTVGDAYRIAGKLDHSRSRKHSRNSRGDRRSAAGDYTRC